MPGEQFEAPVASAPVIHVSVTGADTIVRIDVVKDGKYVYTSNPQARTASLTFRDLQAKAGASYYYVRVFQRDALSPSGDPHVAWTSPWYVTYR